MPFAPFYEYFREVAEAETRVITLLPNANKGLPAGEYTFIEMFCNEPNCDCRRVFFSVTSSNPKKADAVIAYGWETSSFYAKWMHDSTPKTIAALKGPCLNIGSPQSRLAPAILKLVKDVLLQDPAYIRRLQLHYQMYREKIDKIYGSHKKKKRIVPKGLGFG